MRCLIWFIICAVLLWVSPSSGCETIRDCLDEVKTIAGGE